MSRLIVAERGRSRSGLLLVLGLLVLPLFAVAMLPGWFDPELGRLGRAYPEAVKYGRIVPWAVIVAAAFVAAAHLLRGRGVTAIGYGFTRRGRPYVGTLAGGLGLWWRRIRCEQTVRVQCEPPRQPDGTTQYHRIVVSSGRRRLVLWSIALPSQDAAELLDAWLAAHGISRRQIDLPLADPRLPPPSDAGSGPLAE